MTVWPCRLRDFACGLLPSLTSGLDGSLRRVVTAAINPMKSSVRLCFSLLKQHGSLRFLDCDCLKCSKAPQSRKKPNYATSTRKLATSVGVAIFFRNLFQSDMDSCQHCSCWSFFEHCKPLAAVRGIDYGTEATAKKCLLPFEMKLTCWYRQNWNQLGKSCFGFVRATALSNRGYDLPGLRNRVAWVAVLTWPQSSVIFAACLLLCRASA